MIDGLPERSLVQNRETPVSTFSSVTRIAVVVAALCVTTAVPTPAAAQGESKPRERPKFFDGKFLTADELTKDQEYLLRRGSDATAPFGKVSGLAVAIDGGSLTISPGTAITRDGDAVALPAAIRLEAPPADGKYYAMVCADLRDGSRRCLQVAVVERRDGRAYIVGTGPR